MTSEEFLENLLYSATFAEMDKWRRFSAAPEPAEHVMRIFVRMELRLQHRYGLIEIERLVEENRLRLMVTRVKSKIARMGEHLLWSLITTPLSNIN